MFSQATGLMEPQEGIASMETVPLASQKPLSQPHYSLLCGHIIDPILVTFGKKQLSQFRLSHFLFMHLPYKAL